MSFNTEVNSKWTPISIERMLLEKYQNGKSKKRIIIGGILGIIVLLVILTNRIQVIQRTIEES